jgi:hypothetical protein
MSHKNCWKVSNLNKNKKWQNMTQIMRHF